MLKLIKAIYDAGRQAGFNEAELKYKDEIFSLQRLIIAMDQDTEIDLEGIEELDEM